MSLTAVSMVHKTTPNRFTVLTRGTLADDTQHTFNCLSIKAKCTWQSKQSINDRMLKMWSKVKRNWVLLDKQADIWTLAFPFYFFLSFWWLYCFKPFSLFMDVMSDVITTIHKSHVCIRKNISRIRFWKISMLICFNDGDTHTQTQNWYTP